MLKKFMCLALVSAMLLGGCTTGNLPEASSSKQSAAVPAVPSIPTSAAATPSLIMFNAPSPTSPTRTSSAASPLNFSANDVEQLKSYWPLKQRKIDDMGTLDDVSIALIKGEKSYHIMYGFTTDISFNDLYNDLKGYIPGDWKINQGAYASVISGKAEGSVDVSCTIDALNASSKMILLAFTLSDSHGEAAKMLDAHLPGGLLDLPSGFTVPDYEAISLTPGMINFSREWKVPNSKKTFDQIAEGVSGRTGLMHRKLNGSDVDDWITFRDGDVTVEVLSKTLGTVSIGYAVNSSPFPALTPTPAQVVQVAPCPSASSLGK